MKQAYSIYDAKAHLSQILKRVKQGKEIIITERGKPIVKLVPLDTAENFQERLKRFTAAGVVLPSREIKLPQGTKRPGALQRFLIDRE